MTLKKEGLSGVPGLKLTEGPVWPNFPSEDCYNHSGKTPQTNCASGASELVRRSGLVCRGPFPPELEPFHNVREGQWWEKTR